TPVTTFATTCVGSDIPIMVVPAMHQTMYDHPIVMDNLKELREELGVIVVGPKIEEGAAKAAGNEQIVDHVVRELRDDLEGKKMLVITGKTLEPIDSMRVITNRASGKSGVEIAKRAFRRGADIELWYGEVKGEVPRWIPNRSFETMTDLFDMLEGLGEVDIAVVPAALSDFYVKDVKDEKISSSEPLALELEPAPKFIDELKEKVETLVAYKAEDTRDRAKEAAEEMIEAGRADFVVANSLSDVTLDENRVYLSSSKGWIEGSKREIAEILLDELGR
ncbi:MAG: phosphopantothenoylcysteine decarboxylase, partial [Candidatus Aenigmatarchaeota archaeon]